MASFQKTTSLSVRFLGRQLSPQEQLFPKTNWNYQDRNPVRYQVKQCQGKLFVRVAQNSDKRSHLLSNRNEQFLAEWLQYSSAGIVCLHPLLGELQLKTWADLSQRFGKTVFLRILRQTNSPSCANHRNWQGMRSLDRLLALLLLILLIPVLLVFAVLIGIVERKPVLQKQWCVGERGKLFQIYHFSQMNFASVSPKLQQAFSVSIGNLMYKQGLDKLPQLLNILKGEMRFFGRHPWTLRDAIKLTPEKQKTLNTIPGFWIKRF